MTKTKRYSKAKLNKFQKIIIEKMKVVNQDMGDIKEGIIETGESNTSYTPDSIYSVHMADAGTDSHEREKSFQLMAREKGHIERLESFKPEDLMEAFFDFTFNALKSKE